MKAIGATAILAVLAAAGVSAQTGNQTQAARPSTGGQAQQQPALPAINRDVLHVQVILDSLGFGPGVLNGKRTALLANALRGFQETRGLRVTGEADAATLRALYPYRAKRPTIEVEIDPASVAGPFVPQIPKDYAEQAKLDRMAYSSPLEKLAERFHTTPEVLVALNGAGTPLTPGTRITVPNTVPRSRAYPADATPEWRATLASLNVDASAPKAERIVVSKSDKVLRAYDGAGRLIGQYSATIGSASDPLPLGNWKVLHVSPNPDWKMNPAILKSVSDKKKAEIIPPGPNNAVGVVWIDLSREHYGIHGTANPEKIGMTESNGCVRLTNWDAARVALMVKSGTPVIFEA
jgi:lipoprotein-anchoring transpeptidase ErfK/SrfK